MTPTDAAYFAGILDGEGSISLVRSNARASTKYVYPVVRVANTDLALIEWLRVATGSGAAREYASRLNERCKYVHHIGWACADAHRVLTVARPYLVVKRERADIAINLWETNERARLDAGGYFGKGHPIPGWLVEAREVAYAKMKTLNKRGPTCP